MTTANETRGEVSLAFEGVDYVMRPSWEAIDAIETKLGRPLEGLAHAANNSGLTLHEKATIAGEFIRAWGGQTGNQTAARVNDRRLKELIMEEGALVVGKRIGLVLFMAVTGGMTSTGEVKPAEMMSPPPPADAGSLE